MRLITTRNFLHLTILLIPVWLTAQALLNHYVLEPEITFERIPDDVDLTLKNIKYTKTRDGDPLWTLVGDSAAHSTEDGITRINNVRMVFFDREHGDIRLTADQGDLQPEEQTVSVSSNVIVTSAQGNTLETDYLEYDEVSEIMHTDSVVQIRFDQNIVNGKGMEVDVIARTLILLDDVQAQFGTIDKQK